MLKVRYECGGVSGLGVSNCEPIAIVGMAVDVPGASSIQAFWDNLRDGVESISPIDEDALIAAGENPARIHHKDYVAAAARLDGFDEFDAEFFGFSAKEAAILDPQHRKFLEAAWTSLENAGHTPGACGGNIGVYAGCGMGSYFYFNICSNPDLLDDVGMFLLRHTGNDKDFLATRVSHILDLKGPSINIQTACSTSMVAVHYACNALRQGDCDMALAGGVTIELPQGRGYLFKENEILSPDGHCHAFDHRAKGTVFGSGAGCVVLRRLSDALADGDHIWAVIRGSAVNNDGADKASYLAPSVDGQAKAISKAIENAGVQADSIDYVECHGTGTYLGDPIEVTALTEAFRGASTKTGYCRIGSVKTNIGHLDTAAGVASLVKTTLAIKHQQMPPSLSFDAPNPAIDFETSPFRVNDRLTEWEGRDTPRRAGINSLGVGGTNVHAVIEEAPTQAPSEESDWPFQVLCLSGRSKSALEANTAAITAHLRAHPEQPLADIAHTLKNGRRGFGKRRVVVAETHEEAATLLEAGDTRRVFTHDVLGPQPDVVFLFPGGGAQYTGMAQDLYETEPVFAEWMDRGLDHLQAQLDYDIRALWLPAAEDKATAEAKLKTPSAQLPLIMIVEYALAQLWMSWGVKPSVLVGHSMGENTAACLAGVMRFEDCIDLVLLRGRLFDTVPKGGMLSVSVSVEKLGQLVGEDLDIASVNAPELSAVSGPQEQLDRFAAKLDDLGLDYQRIAIDIAAHSRMLDPILEEFRTFLNGLDLKPAQLPVMSNRTGQLMTGAQATDPGYWVEQLRHRIEFRDCISNLPENPERVFLEVGPGKALSALVQMSDTVQPGQVISSLRHPDHDMADDAYFLSVIGRLWACGVEADWGQFWGEARRNRVVLPTYAFQRKRYFIEPGKGTLSESDALMRMPAIEDWGYSVAWRPVYADTFLDAEATLSDLPARTWLMFMDGTDLAAKLAGRMENGGHRVARVFSGDTTEQHPDGTYTIAPEMGRAAYEQLFGLLSQAEELPTRIAHFWLVTGEEVCRPGSSFFDRNMEHGFFSLLHLAQAIGDIEMAEPVHVTVITNGAEQVADEPLPYPEKALIAGPVGVAPRELPGVTVTTIDVERPVMEEKTRRRFWHKPAWELDREVTTDWLMDDLLATPSNLAVTYRGGKRYEKSYKPTSLPGDNGQNAGFRKGGIYLITGGFGGVGLTLAQDLAENYDANIILLTRTAMPEREMWESYLTLGADSDPCARRITALKTLEQAGQGQVLVVTADVCNRDDMARAKAVIDREFGSLTGVIHAAGAIDDAPLLAKSVSDVASVLAPKVTGLRVLDSLFRDGELELMVLCSSTSTVTTPAGQIDYVAANSYFNAFARARAGGHTRVVSVNWGVWADVGMAADALADRTNPRNTDEAELEQPLLDSMRFDGDVQVFEAEFSAARDWVIDGHRTAAGDALLPGTAYVELVAEAMAARGVTQPYEIQDLSFLRPFDVVDGQARRAEARVTNEGGALLFELRGACTFGGREGMVRNAQAWVAPLAGPAPAKLDTVAVAARCPTRETARGDEWLPTPQEKHLDFGGRWQVLRDTAKGDGEGLAWLSLSADCKADLAEGYTAHPGLLDIATGWAMDLVPGYSADVLWVPVSYRSIKVWRSLPEAVQSWVRLADTGEWADGQAGFDISLCDATGQVCMEITGLRMQRLQKGTAFGRAAAIAPSEVVFDDGPAAAYIPLSAEEERLQHNISQGIRPEDGPEALRRALTTGLPQVIVSSLDLDGLTRQAAATRYADMDQTQSFERPDLDGDYQAPGTETEKALADQWEKLLGVSPIGVDDSFFDLGGHSLIAVRLFAAIKRSFGVEFPISVLFEAPTIGNIAALIEAQPGRPVADDIKNSDALKPDEPSKSSFAYLVALNRVEAPTKPPVFIVAGMFGNVLNLRHLAQQLGGDQPVYGVQARGLVGDEAPHTRIEDAARDYLAEIRQLQPEGPYLLGGFSGGGITAYEMAQQLQAAGQQIALLALLDTPLPVRPALGRWDKALIKLQEFRHKGLAYLGEWAVNRLRWELEKRRGAEVSPAPGGFNNSKIERAFRQAVATYHPKPWHGPLLLFRPPLDKHWKVSNGRWISQEREYVFEDNQWTGWAPGIRVVEVTGDHDSMVLNPNVTVLAAHLRDEIAAMSQPATATSDDHPGGWQPATAAE